MKNSTSVMYGLILYADSVNITNEKTGEVTEMTKVVYTVPIEDTDNHVGSGILECYLQGNKLKLIEPFTKEVEVQGKKYRQVCQLELNTRLIKNGQKLYISKINNIELK